MTDHPTSSRIARLGGVVVDAYRAGVELWMVGVSTVAGIVRGLARKQAGRPRGEVWRQMHSIGNRSVLFIVVTLGFIGMVMTYEACNQIGRVTGDYSQIGGNLIRLIISDFGPVLTGMMLATRVGAGIAAEIGSMKVTEQIDALRMSGVLPIDYLIVPRFTASVVMTLMLVTLGSLVMFTAGGLTAIYSFGVNPHLFFDISLVRPRHVAMLVIKAMAFGAAIPVVAGFCGLRARGSSEGVGWATTAAVIGASFSVIALDFVISAAALFLTGGDLVTGYIEWRGVTKAFADKPVLRGMDLTVTKGEVLFIIGTSGVGKSVTIKHLVGLLRIDAGEIWFDGERVDQLAERQLTKLRRRIGMVFQSSTLFDSMTLAENVALPLRKHQHMRWKPALEEARHRLAQVYMADYADRYPAELSDGMRKRAAIARTLALGPEVVLFDEPTTGLDPVSARRIDRLIRELAEKLGVTAVVVSHDPPSIFGIADRVAFLYQGIVHVVATPAELRASPDPIVQQFILGKSSGPMETPGF